MPVALIPCSLGLGIKHSMEGVALFSTLLPHLSLFLPFYLGGWRPALSGSSKEPESHPCLGLTSWRPLNTY